MADGYFKTRWKRALRSTGKLWSELTGKDDQPGDEIISQLQNLKSRIANAGTKEQLEKLLREYRELSANVELPGDLALESVESLAKNIQNHIENRDAGLISQAVMEERIREAVLKHALANIDQEFKKFEELHKLEEEHQEFFIRVIENRNKILQATQPLPDNAETHAIAEEMGMAHNFWQQTIEACDEHLDTIKKHREMIKSLPNSKPQLQQFNDQVKPREQQLTKRKLIAQAEIEQTGKARKMLPPDAQRAFDKAMNEKKSYVAIAAQAKQKQEEAKRRQTEEKIKEVEARSMAKSVDDETALLIARLSKNITTNSSPSVLPPIPTPSCLKDEEIKGKS